MGRIISRHLEELATPRISEWGGSQIGGRWSAMLVVRGADLLSGAIVEPVVACCGR